MRRASLILIVILMGAVTGCVRRTITVSSDPSGALVWLNGREVGRTPVTVDFTYYGTYDVQLQAEGYEPLVTTGQANPPWWDQVPLDFFAEITPGEKNSRIEWHYQLAAMKTDRNALIERARDLRQQIPATQPASSMPASTTAPASQSAPAGRE
jgi:hypothetical protein